MEDILDAGHPVLGHSCIQILPSLCQEELYAMWTLCLLICHGCLDSHHQLCACVRAHASYSCVLSLSHAHTTHNIIKYLKGHLWFQG